MHNSILQYTLGYCTWYGLSTIGEPPLTQSNLHRHDGIPLDYDVMDPKLSREMQDPMPAWLMFLFIILVATRYIASFLVSSPDHWASG